MSFGSTMVRLRNEKGVYQKELASYLKVSIGTVSNYEKDRHFPDQATLCKIAEYFGVTVDYLLERNSFRYNPEELCRPFTDNYTVSDFINISLDLSPKRRNSLTEYALLLKLQERTEAAGD